jgi:hypothetical protein
MYRHSWKPFWTYPTVLPVPLIKLFFYGEKQNDWRWDYYPQVLDYQGIQIIDCQIKGVLLHYTVSQFYDFLNLQFLKPGNTLKMQKLNTTKNRFCMNV